MSDTQHEQIWNDRLQLAYYDGYDARSHGESRNSNPHKSDDVWKAWQDGWMDKTDELRNLTTSTADELSEVADELSDLDQNNPVDVSAETWTEIYARNPDLLDDDHGMD